MNLSSCLYCIYYNLLSNFYIGMSTFLPGFEQDIINLQYKTIQSINEDYVFAYNTRKRKRFNIFVDNLVKKNNEFLEKIRQEEYEDNDIENYDRINDEEESDFSESEQESDFSCNDTEKNEDDNEDDNGEDNGDDNKNDLDNSSEHNIQEECIVEETIYEDDKKNN